MRAARFNGPKDITITDIPAPKLRPGSVSIKIAWCGICGIDLHEYLEGPIFIPRGAIRTPSPTSKSR